MTSISAAHFFTAITSNTVYSSTSFIYME